jgi:hypothetical protein
VAQRPSLWVQWCLAYSSLEVCGRLSTTKIGRVHVTGVYACLDLSVHHASSNIEKRSSLTTNEVFTKFLSRQKYYIQNDVEVSRSQSPIVKGSSDMDMDLDNRYGQLS